jgi:hypothetical protein
LHDKFKAYLSIPGSATAGEELRELTRSRLSVANSLTTSLNRDVTLEVENITLAFSERIRVFGFLTENNNNNSTIYRNYFGYSKTWPENTYRPEGTLPTP